MTTPRADQDFIEAVAELRKLIDECRLMREQLRAILEICVERFDAANAGGNPRPSQISIRLATVARTGPCLVAIGHRIRANAGPQRVRVAYV